MHYIISDLHNCNQRFCELLEKIRFSENDHLCILGDVFDRSSHDPNPVDLYFNIERLGERCDIIRGNHDHWLGIYILEYYALPERKRSRILPYSYNSFQLLQKRLTSVDLQNLAYTILSWPLQKTMEVKGEKYLLAHAMTSKPGVIKAEDYYLIGTSLNDSYLNNGIDGYISICGHTNTDNGRIWKNHKKNLYMIDCGCGFNSGRLGCLCLETREEFYV